MIKFNDLVYKKRSKQSKKYVKSVEAKYNISTNEVHTMVFLSDVVDTICFKGFKDIKTNRAYVVIYEGYQIVDNKEVYDKEIIHIGEENKEDFGITIDCIKGKEKRHYIEIIDEMIIDMFR